MKTSSTFLSAVAVAAGIAGLATYGPIGIVLVALISLVYGVLVYKEQSRKSNVNVSILDSISFRPALPRDIEKIVGLDRASFDKSEIIDAKTFSEWHEKNHKTFYCLFSDELLIGYFCLLPLKPSSLERFVAGEIGDRDFKGSDILSPGHVTAQCADLYLFSIAVLEKHRHSANSIYLLAKLAEALQQMHERNHLQKIYATAATDAGRKLIKRFKFDFVQAAKYRKDEHDLYRKDVSKIKDFRRYIRSKFGG